jgi:hypothetical protein
MDCSIGGLTDMKKFFTVILCFVVLFQCGCVNYPYYEASGVWESENPKIKIIIDNDSSHWGDYGILTNDDGSNTKIVFKALHGQFIIYKYQQNGQYGLDSSMVLFKGTFKTRKESLILKTEDGQKIILKRTSEQLPNSKDLY